MPARSFIAPAIAATLIAAGLLWVAFRDTQPPAVAIAPATIAPQVRGLPTVAVTPRAPVRAYAPEARRRLGVEHLTRASEAVVAASRIEPDDPHPKTLITTLDLETGDVRSIERTEPLPWLRATSRGEVGLYYGFRAGEPAPVVRVQATQALLDIKAMRVQASASADQAGDWFAGVGVAYRW